MPIKEQRVPKSRLLRFANVQKLVGGDIVQCLMNTGGPGNFDFRSGCWPKPEMQPLVACGKITSSCRREPGLSIDSHSRTKAVAIAARATQRNYQPMLLAATIDQYHRMPTKRGHHCVFPPIVIQIAECRSTAGNRNRDSGVTVPVAGRGAAFGDLNNDGWEDAVMTSLGGHPVVLINRGGKQHWLVISLRGTRSNRDGLGARVRVNGQTRFATAAGSYLSASDKRLHFGLGAATTAKV